MRGLTELTTQTYSAAETKHMQRWISFTTYSLFVVVGFIEYTGISSEVGPIIYLPPVAFTLLLLLGTFKFFIVETGRLESEWFDTNRMNG